MNTTEVSSVEKKPVQNLNGKRTSLGHAAEMQFILEVLRTEWPDNKKSLLEDLESVALDWRMVLRLALHHGVLDLIYHRTRDHDDLGLPESLVHSLHANNQLSAHKNLFLASQLIKIRDMFEEHGIEAISLKGPLLGSYLYDNISLRPFGDLDIVVRHEKIFEAKKLLVSEGFRPDHIMSAAEERDYVDRQYALVLIKHIGDYQIVAELHWALTHKFFSFRFTPDEVWKRTRPLTLSNVSVETLQNPLLMLFLCVHGAKHDWDRLIWLCDIDRLVRRFTDDEWVELFDLAARTRSMRMVTVGLELSRALFGTSLPELAFNRIERDSKTRYWVNELVAELTCGIPAKARAVFSMRFQTGVREDIRDRIGSYLQSLKLIFKPADKDRKVVNLPRLFSPLYYLIRPIRILIERRRK